MPIHMPNACQCKPCSRKRTPTKDAISASGILTTEQIGPKQSFTASGFLLCQDVPIARIGVQDYAAIELPEIEDKDGVIEVERSEDVVFAPETLASFEGCPITIEHPNDPVDPRNWMVLAKGTVHNVRRGEGDMSDFVLADLLVMDKGAIHDVTSKRLREISAGYDASYEQVAPGRARQTSIVGNHVALLAGSARCGEVCSVQDSKPSIGETQMAIKKGAQSFADTLRKMFMSRDSEGFEKALEEVKDDGMGEPNGTHVHVHLPGGADPKPAITDADPATPDPAADPSAKIIEAINAVGQQVATLAERVSVLEAGKTTDADPKPDPDPDPDPDAPPAPTKDSTALRDEYQDAKARAEILAPGIKLPTYDAKADSKTTVDGLCALRRRALGVALEGANADLVKAVTGDADVSKLTCDSAKAFFNAASELVKRKNISTPATPVRTGDEQSSFSNINQTNAAFWAKRT